jgi:hypothetical protein
VLGDSISVARPVPITSRSKVLAEILVRPDNVPGLGHTTSSAPNASPSTSHWPASLSRGERKCGLAASSGVGNHRKTSPPRMRTPPVTVRPEVKSNPLRRQLSMLPPGCGRLPSTSSLAKSVGGALSEAEMPLPPRRSDGREDFDEDRTPYPRLFFWQGGLRRVYGKLRCGNERRFGDCEKDRMKAGERWVGWKWQRRAGTALSSNVLI